MSKCSVFAYNLISICVLFQDHLPFEDTLARSHLVGYVSNVLRKFNMYEIIVLTVFQKNFGHFIHCVFLS